MSNDLMRQARRAWARLRRRRRTITLIAEQLGIRPQAVWVWSVVPLHRLHDVARITSTPWQELRPDLAALPQEVVAHLIEHAVRHVAKVARPHPRKNGKHRSRHQKSRTTKKLKPGLKSKNVNLSTNRTTKRASVTARCD